MRYRKLGQTKINVSVVGMGAWAIGGDSFWGPNDDQISIRTIHEARDFGINLIDTAPTYGLGHSEEIVGKALKGRRSEYVLATKCGLVWDGQEGAFKMDRDGAVIRINLTAMSLRRQLEASLRRLGTDYIDLYITHWQAIEPFKTPISETMETLQSFVKEGWIRAVGVSNVTPDELEEYSQYGDVALAQQKYSLLDRTHEDTLLPVCEALGTTFQAYSPLERGMLTGKVTMDTEIEGNAKKNTIWYEPDKRAAVLAMLEQFRPLCDKYSCTLTKLIVAWTAARSEQMNVLCGARKIRHVEENAGGGDLILDPADFQFMDAAARQLFA